ncbi:MAG: hypothetical protein COC23_03145 [Hyphomicrobiales bacterium]|nr:MAG: hypothetical protein COC23_03145 [Hyphomicrobiales bacterium]
MRFNGEKYVVIPDGVAGLAKKNSTKLILEAKESESYLGKCYRGYKWSGWPRDSRSGSGADYAECGFAEPVLNFACTPNSPYIELSIEIGMPGLEDGEQTSVRAYVGKKRFNLNGRGSYSDYVGGTRPVLNIKKTDPFFSEFKKASRVSLVFGRTKFTAHLKGSAGAINALFASCR